MFSLVQVIRTNVFLGKKKVKSKSKTSQMNFKSCQNKTASAELMPWNPFTKSISWDKSSADASQVTDTL